MRPHARRNPDFRIVAAQAQRHCLPDARLRRGRRVGRAGRLVALERGRGPGRPGQPRSLVGHAATSRLALDRLRAAKVRREHYPGLWLPEPVLSDSPPTPQEVLERADDISVAFLMLLEQLAPEARAAFLMREVFDAGYPEVAQAIGKSEAACRQLVHRAKEQLREGRPRQRARRTCITSFSAVSPLPRCRATSLRSSRCWTRTRS